MTRNPDRFFDLAATTKVNPDDTYIKVYPFLISYFRDLEKIDEKHVICGAHMVYGWMPTVLKRMHWNPDTQEELRIAAKILNEARQGKLLTQSEVHLLSELINNSVVGASKLLHFVSPNLYPIWDSRVYRFIYKKEPYHNAVNNIENYIEYAEYTRDLALDPKTRAVHEAVEHRLGYTVTKVRAIELIMFLNGAAKKRKKGNEI